MATSVAIDKALQAEQLRQHAAAVRGSLAASLVITAVLAALLWGMPRRELLIGWLGWLAVLAASRGGVLLWHRSAPPDADPAPWLRRFRLSFAAHGLGWGAAAVLLLPAGGHADADVLVFALTALAGGVWFTTVFDPLAACAFSVPVLAPLLLQLFGAPPDGAPRTGVMVVMFLAVTVAGGLRAHRGVRETVRLRLADDERADAQRRSAEQAEASARALAEKHRLIDLLVETTHQGFWFIDTDGLTTEANPAMCALLGRRREEVIGHSVYEFFTRASLDTIQSQLEARRRGRTGGYDVEIVRPDGSRRHCFNSATPLYGADGRQVGSIGIWTDLTERREAELVLRAYEAVTQSITDLVSVIGEDRIYRLVNDAWCRAMNIERDQVIGRDAAEAMPQAATPQRLRALHECLASGEQRTVRGLSEIPSLAGRQLETTFYPYGADAAGVRCVVMVTRDVTEQEQSRAALAESAEYLRRTLNATGDAIFASDAGNPQEPVRFANDQMLQMFGIPQDKAARLTPADIMSYAMPLFEDPAGESRRIQTIIESESSDQSHLHLRDGRVLVRRCIPARIGGRTVRVWSFRDVTAEERALEAVRSRDAEQRALLDAFPGFIARLDPANRYTHVNERMAALIGATPEQILGRTVGDMLGASYTGPMRAQFERALAGETVTYERHQPAAAAGHAATDVQITLARGVDPTTGGPAVYAFGIDISSLKQAEQALRASESELRALLGAFPGHIAVLDPDLSYSFVNERFAEVIGVAPARIVGLPAREVLGEALFEQKAEEARRARAGERVVTERSYPAQAGRPRLDLEVTLVAGPVQGDGRQAIYSFGVDITARKRAEEAMAAARDEAERANQAKSQFLSHMSHELRTPLNAIIGFGQLLGSDPGHALAPRQQGYVREIVQGGRHLLDLINDVLDLGRIEAGKLVVDPAPVPLCDLAAECLALVRPLADGHGVRIEPPAGDAFAVAVSADRMRLKQVLINLLSNAIKYNRPGGHVTLLCEHDDAAVRLGVRDTGHGLSPSELARLFQPFERLGAAHTGIEGTGIGLVLSRRLAEAMGGSLEVDSRVGEGSTFWVRLRLAQPRATGGGAAPTRPGALEPAADTGSRTVLYIEDNPVNVMLMEAMLARLPGLRMISAAVPHEGLQAARSERPALILLDIQLPGMDGYEVMRRLRSREETRDIPVIAVTANAMGSEADAAMAAGFAAYLTKPLDLDTLLDTVQHTLQATA